MCLLLSDNGSNNYLGWNITLPVLWDTGYEMSHLRTHIYISYSPLSNWLLNSCPQLINELGPVDARLAPQFRKLLAGEEADKSTSRPAEGQKSRISSKKEKVSFLQDYRPGGHPQFESASDV